jgi:cell division protein FtsB
MVNFQSRRKLKNVLYSRLSVIILVIVVALLSKSVWDIYKKSAITTINKERTQAELDQLEDRQIDLASRIEKLQTSRGVEEEVRRNLSVVKEGEKVVTIVSNPTSTDASGVSWWRRLVGRWR